MKIGLKLHHSGPGACPDYMRRWTEFAEILGLHLIMMADHAALTADVQAQYTAPYTSLSEPRLACGTDLEDRSGDHRDRCLVPPSHTSGPPYR